MVEDFGRLLSAVRAVPVHFVDAVASVVASDGLSPTRAFNGEDHGVVDNLAAIGPELHVEDHPTLRIEFASVRAAHSGINRSRELALDLIGVEGLAALVFRTRLLNALVFLWRCRLVVGLSRVEDLAEWVLRPHRPKVAVHDRLATATATGPNAASTSSASWLLGA